MKNERPYAKLQSHYILNAIIMGNMLYSNDWKYGDIYLTNKNLWFTYNNNDWDNILLDKVTMVGRSVPKNVSSKAKRYTGYSPTLIIDHLSKSSFEKSNNLEIPSVTLIANEQSIVNTLKNYLVPFCKNAVQGDKSLTDFETKILYLLYTGLADVDKMSYILGVEKEIVQTTMTELELKNMHKNCQLTRNGHNIIRRTQQ